MKINEVIVESKNTFLKPGMLAGSYTDAQLTKLGFRKATNGSWYIPTILFQKLVSSGQLRESNRPHKSKNKVTDEDYDPNGPPPGPEFKPTMPKGTVRVDVSDVYDWYKLGKNISNLDRADPSMFGKGPPSTIMAFGSEDEEHNYIEQLKKLGLATTDIDPIDTKQPKNMPRQKVDPTYNVNEDTKNKVTFKLRKSKTKFALTMLVDGQEAGVYEYDSNSGRSIAEVFPEFKGKGYGKVLVLKAIYTAAMLGMYFYEDESRTQEYNNVIDSLDSNGYIVSDDDGRWFVTDTGEQFLTQTLTEASGYIPSEKEKNDPRFKTALTVDVKPDSIKKNAKKLGLGNIRRTGVPPTANPNGKR